MGSNFEGWVRGCGLGSASIVGLVDVDWSPGLKVKLGGVLGSSIEGVSGGVVWLSIESVVRGCGFELVLRVGLGGVV